MSQTSINLQNVCRSPNKSFKLKTKSCFLPISPLFAHSCQRPSADVPAKLPCHQAEWHQQRQPGGRRWQQHTALTGMSIEMQLRPLTAHSFWHSALRGKSFNRPDFKYFSNLPNHICFPKWGVLMFKESIRLIMPGYWPLMGSADMSMWVNHTLLLLWLLQDILVTRNNHLTFKPSRNHPSPLLESEKIWKPTKELYYFCKWNKIIN